MEIEKTLKLAAPSARVWEMLLDPQAMATCVPGMQSIEVVSPTVYKAVMAVKVSFISAKFLMFGDEPRAQAESTARGTIAVMADGSEPAEVTVDGAAVGVLKGDAPLTLSGIELSNFL